MSELPVSVCVREYNRICSCCWVIVYHLTFPFKYLLGSDEMTISARDCFSQS